MLLQKIQTDLITALKAGDSLRVGTLRFLVAAIKKYEIDTYPPSLGGKLTDSDTTKIIQRQVKTHRESIEAFTKANRTDLVDKEKKELDILSEYMPKELTDAEITAIVEKIKSIGVTNFGAIMGATMKEVAGRADGNKVAKIVKEVFV